MSARVWCASIVASLIASTAAAQEYRLPLRLPDTGAQPYITAHRDDNAGGGVDDYSCGSDTYNGHDGTDIGIGGFTAMDAGRTVVAAAAGRVAAVRDGCFDRCTSGACDCADGFGNYVRIDHEDGKRTYYAHLKMSSLQVSVGDDVACGAALGKVGSSGNSTGPHLHFEVRHADNSSDDPYEGDCGGPSSYWRVQGAYGALPGTSCDGTTEPPPPTASMGELRGVVFADTGAGTADMTTRLSGASIVVVGADLTTTAVGDEASWSFAAVAAGSWTVRVSAPGYVTGERTCDVTADGTTWCSVGLVAVAVDVGDDAGSAVDAGADEGPGDAGHDGAGDDDEGGGDAGVDEGNDDDAGSDGGAGGDGDTGDGNDDDDDDGEDGVIALPTSAPPGCAQTPPAGALAAALVALAAARLRRRRG